MTQEPLLTGEARDGNERFNFAIKRFVTGGFLLEISYIHDKGHGIYGAGVWPSIGKAKEIAQETATKLLHDASISWNEGKVSSNAGNRISNSSRPDGEVGPNWCQR